MVDMIFSASDTWVLEMSVTKSPGLLQADTICSRQILSTPDRYYLLQTVTICSSPILSSPGIYYLIMPDTFCSSQILSAPGRYYLLQPDTLCSWQILHAHTTQMPGTIKPFFIEINTLVEKQKYPLVAN